MHVPGGATHGPPGPHDVLHQVPRLEGPDERSTDCADWRAGGHGSTGADDLTRTDVTGVDTGRLCSHVSVPSPPFPDPPVLPPCEHHVTTT